MPHILSFDVEEYFQVEAAAAGGVKPGQWDSFEKRLATSVECILGLLAEYKASATFFVLGWVAQHERSVVRMIADAGHEIASHGMSHTMIGHLTPRQFRGELLRSRKILEDISGKSVIGYRAPTFSITHKTAWALDILAETGYQYDSSVFPVRHDRYGVPNAPRFPHRAVGPSGGEIIEIPPLTVRLVGMNLPVGGGGYLRLLPVSLVIHALNKAQKIRRPGMIYLHPWELDPDQPTLQMSRVNRWRHRVNLGRTAEKLSQLLARFTFLSVRQIMDALASCDTERYLYGFPESR